MLETALIKLFEWQMQRRIKRDWMRDHPPHFSYNNYGAFRLALLNQTVGPYPFYRGFLSSSLVRTGDKVLDIGCGDGFFSTRFLACKAAHVDAIDIEEDAVLFAGRYNAAPNVSFRVMDATKEFPSSGYDLAVWDGAIGHFHPADTNAMIVRVKAALRNGGVFCGSEVLGREGADHFQFWETLDEASALFKPHFKHVELQEWEYFYDLAKTGRRREFAWRCSDEPLSGSWRRY